MDDLPKGPPYVFPTVPPRVLKTAFIRPPPREEATQLMDSEGDNEDLIETPTMLETFDAPDPPAEEGDPVAP